MPLRTQDRTASRNQQRPAVGRAARLAVALLTACALHACAPADEGLIGRIPIEPGPPRVLVGTNYDGQTFDLSAVDTEFKLVFFGFTSCPDVCPITLGSLATVRAQLNESDRLAIVFASVDPRRDSLHQIAAYIRAFDPQAYGVRLETEQLAATISSFGLVVEVQPPFDPDQPEHYAVDHTASMFLLDGDDRVVLTFPAYTDPQLIVGDLAQLLQ